MQSQNTRVVRRRKRRVSPLALTLMTALALIALAGIILLASGYRYITKDGVKFSGHVKNGQPTDGTVHYSDGISGKLTKDENSALGKIVYSTGDVFEGSLNGVAREGKGVITYKNGDKYEGDFAADKLTGEAVFTSASGAVYTGAVSDGKPNGQGKYVFADGSYYYGDWADGKRNGVGEEHYPDGSYYYGAFVDDKRTGSSEITVTLENGMVYTGKNKFSFSNGDSYVGDYLNGKRNGNGKYTWASGQSYDGAWVSDVMEGEGTYDFGNGKAPYTGTFAGGQIAEAGDTQTASPETSDTGAAGTSDAA